MAVFRPGAAQDLSGEAYRVMLTGARTSCDINKKTGETGSSLHLTFRATRAPSADGAAYSVPYFVAVTQRRPDHRKAHPNRPLQLRAGRVAATFDESPDDFEIHVATASCPMNIS